MTTKATKTSQRRTPKRKRMKKAKAATSTNEDATEMPVPENPGTTAEVDSSSSSNNGSAGTSGPPKRRRRTRSSGRKADAPPADATKADDAAGADEAPADEGTAKKAPSRRGKRKRKARSPDPEGGNAQPSEIDVGTDAAQSAAPGAPPDEFMEALESQRAAAVDADVAILPIPDEEKSESSPEPRKRRSRRRRGRRDDGNGRPPDEDRKSEPAKERDKEQQKEPRSASKRAESAPPAASGNREMIINVAAGEECRIAVLHNGRLEELFMERRESQSLVHNIYKGRVTNVEPSIQAAFVDFGQPKQGFLHILDVHPQYFPNHSGENEDVGRKTPRHHRPPIQQCLRRGREVIVQVTKDGVGTKGPTLTTYLSIPGRFLVMMPGMNRHGVSRRIEDDEQRRKMRAMMGELEFPPNMGFIMRTAGMDQNKRELQRDLHYLMRLWKTVVDRVKSQPSPTELYRESDLVVRTIRDVYSSDFKRIVVDDDETAERVREFLRIAMPRTNVQVETYADREPIFYRFGIEDEIDEIHLRQVPLKSGGSLVIDSTEAMVTIDVNSGKFRKHEDAEETAYQINMEAAREIARQLRLRDLGGLIVCDFIDMRFERHKRAVERALRDGLKEHKERARILRMSAFGLIEMTRQRQGPSIKRSIYTDCKHCNGTGLVKMPQSVTLDVMRLIQLAADMETVRRITIYVSAEVAVKILNEKREAVLRVEKETGKRIIIEGKDDFRADQVEYYCEDTGGRPISLGAGYIQRERQMEGGR